ncbi:S8/S53 family peptidase [Bdellovibrio bacteriovorus]|uniref:S8/S53 family peptidase n=1 Tax=Bdellovibrio bacteriovorus TaxID=959 RepID=UPI003A806CFD
MKNQKIRILACVLGLFSSFQATAFVELEKRQPLEVEDGRLTPYWAQEYIGADLVKEEMRLLPNLQRVPMAVYDVGFEKEHINLAFDIPVDRAMNGNRPMKGHHGTSVASLINGKGMVSVSEFVNYVQLKKVSPAVFYFGAVRELKELPVKPQVISNSMGWTSESVLELATEVDQMGIIWVMAAGNEHPNEIAEHERVAPVISVGSYSPRGLQTLSSQESDQLDILAPADEYQAALDGNGQEVLFGETSGATPLISASIANAKALIPSLSRAQIESLMKRTAIRSFHSLYSEKNKAGLFNAYRFFKVVQRLHAVCGANAPCIQAQMDNRQNYLFEAQVLSPRITAVCHSRQGLSKAEMKALRTQYLLNAEQSQYARLLSCAYRNEGYSINADYYENIALIHENPKALQNKIQTQAVQAVLHGYTASASLRDLQILNDSFREALLKILSGETGMEPYQARDLLKAYDNTVKVELP